MQTIIRLSLFLLLIASIPSPAADLNNNSANSFNQPDGNIPAQQQLLNQMQRQQIQQQSTLQQQQYLQQYQQQQSLNYQLHHNLQRLQHPAR